MFDKRYITVMMAVVFGVSTLYGASASLSRTGDINNDNRVDVLDIQTIAASLLASMDSTVADVNGDGSVDVLDFQRLMAQTERTGSCPERPVKLKTEGILCGASNLLPFIPLARRGAEIPAATDVKPGASHFGDNEFLLTRLPRCERYLTGCSPNSPPATA